MNRSRYIVFYALPVVLYCALIFFQSSFAAPDEIPDLPYMDKVLHFCGYALLGALFLRAYRPVMTNRTITSLIFWSIFSSTLYGVTDEIHQHFVAERSADVFDVLMDFIGSIGGVFVYHTVVDKFYANYPYHSRIDKIAGIL